MEAGSAATFLDVPSIDVLRRRRSAKWRMHAADVLPLSIAEMDFEAAEPVASALRAAVSLSDFGYADGFETLAAAYADFAAAEWGWRPEPAWMRPVADVGVGTVELLRAGGAERVVISSPVYPPFQDWVRESGAVLTDVPLRAGRLDLERLDDAFSVGGDIVYLLCNPQNPTGTAHSVDELTQLVELATRYGVAILSDEIHAPLALPGTQVTPILSIPDAADVSFALTSASKAWNLAGLKCALVIAGHAKAAGVLGQLPPDTRWRVGHLGVIAATAAFSDAREWRQRLLPTIADRHQYFAGLVRDRLPELELRPPAAGYLAWLGTRGACSGSDLAAAVLEHGRVAVEPGERFGAGGAGHIRVNVATSRELLEAGVDGIRKGLDALTQQG